MTSSALLNVPKSIDEWNFWSFNNRSENQRIRQAVQTQSSGRIRLFEYQLDPIAFDDVTNWLARNQQAHDDFNQALGLNGVDLEGVDFTDPKQLQSWIYLNWQEIQSAELALGI